MKKIILFAGLLLPAIFSFSQNVGIGTSTPNSSAALDVTAANKGILPPRVALSSINDAATVVSPAAGLLVYNTATAGTVPNNVVPGYYYYTGTVWLRISNAGNAAGDMQYWNGSQWVILSAGATGLTLTMCNGVPTWGPCSIGGVSPTVVTSSISNIAANTATAGGNVTADGGATVTVRGVCYSRTANPTIADTTVNAASGGTGSFSVSLTQLAASTLYHVRAFATNSAGTSYGGDSSFTTIALTLPTVTTNAVFGIGSTTANSGGSVTSNGGATLTARGIVYGTAASPTLANSVVTDGGTSTGSYTSSMSGLVASTTYHVRAYATNSLGTSYGNDISFTTLATGFFSAIYTFDSVKTTSGLIDPTPLPSVTGLTFGAFSATGAGSPTFNSTAAFRFSLTDWTLGAINNSDVFTSTEDSTGKYYEVTITPNAGKSLTLTSLSFRYQRSSTGVRQAFVRSNRDSYAGNLAASINPANANLSIAATNKFQMVDGVTQAQDGCTITLSGAAYTNATTPVTFRLYGINAEASGGTFSIDNVVFNGSVQ